MGWWGRGERFACSCVKSAHCSFKISHFFPCPSFSVPFAKMLTPAPSPCSVHLSWNWKVQINRLDLNRNIYLPAPTHSRDTTRSHSQKLVFFFFQPHLLSLTGHYGSLNFVCFLSYASQKEDSWYWNMVCWHTAFAIELVAFIHTDRSQWTKPSVWFVLYYFIVWEVVTMFICS